MLTRKAFSEADPHWTARGSPWVSEKLSCDMWIGFRKWNYIYSATTWHKKNGIVWGVLVAQNWGWSGISYDQNCSFVSDGVTSVFFEPFRKSKTLRKLVVCGVENVIVIKMSFCCLADAAVLKYTIYTPISGVCENKMMVKLEYTKALQ